MTFQYCSDLHLEFWENKEFLERNPLQPKGDILLLAGDIVPFTLMQKHTGFFDFISANFEISFWLPGNHEYYGSDAATRSGVVLEKIRENIFLVNNISLQQGSVKLVFSTLWGEIMPLNRGLIEHNVSDFHSIKFHKHPFSGAIFNHFHHEAMDFLRYELSHVHTGKTVVVSHHVPTFMNYPDKYRGSILNEAFGIELFNLIERSPIDYWIYGHHHNNTPDFTIGKTTLLTNQLGYVRYGEHKDFRGDKIIKL
jgi:predicted phosphohydrolase